METSLPFASQLNHPHSSEAFKPPKNQKTHPKHIGSTTRRVQDKAVPGFVTAQILGLQLKQ